VPAPAPVPAIDSIDSAVSFNPAASRSAPTTVAPSDARRCEIACPMPAAAPVTNATFPLNRPSFAM
jgi:hypothetical protein